MTQHDYDATNYTQQADASRDRAAELRRELDRAFSNLKKQDLEHAKNAAAIEEVIQEALDHYERQRAPTASRGPSITTHRLTSMATALSGSAAAALLIAATLPEMPAVSIAAAVAGFVGTLFVENRFDKTREDTSHRGEHA